MNRVPNTSTAQACYEQDYTIVAHAAFAAHAVDGYAVNISKELISATDVIVFRPDISSASLLQYYSIRCCITVDDPSGVFEVSIYITNLTAGQLNRPGITGKLVFLA